MDRVLLDLSEAGRQGLVHRYGVTRPPPGITISGNPTLSVARRASALWTELILTGGQEPLSAWLDRPEYWTCRLCGNRSVEGGQA